MNKRSWANQKPPVGTAVNKSHPLAKNLQACFLFNEGAGKIAMNGARSGNKSITGTQAWSASPGDVRSIGPALQFDGSSTYIDCGNNAAGDPLKPTTFPVTVALLAKVDLTLTGTKTIMACEEATARGYNVNFFNAGAGFFFEFGMFTGAAYPVARVAVANNVWHLVVAQWLDNTATGYRIFLNGVEPSYSLRNTPGGVAYSTQPVNIGRNPLGGSPSRYLLGYLDFLYFWNRALTVSEILHLSKNPYSFFYTPRRRTMAVVESGPPPTSSTTKINRMMLMGMT